MRDIADDIRALLGDVLRKEAAALLRAADSPLNDCLRAVDLICCTTGKVVIVGLGKSGQVGAKIAATFSSTGSPSFFLHAAEAIHGDLGVLRPGDLVIALSYSGETREVVEVAQFARSLGIPVIGMCRNPSSALAMAADLHIEVQVDGEADPLGLAPSTSSTLMLGLGDALAFGAMAKKKMSVKDFANWHPGGTLGLELAEAHEYMKPLAELSVLSAGSSFDAILGALTSPNYGIVAVLDAEGRLLGCISDGDIRRKIALYRQDIFAMTAGELMTAGALSTERGMLVRVARERMQDRRITSLFVVDEELRFAGLLRLQDIL